MNGFNDSEKVLQKLKEQLMSVDTSRPVEQSPVYQTMYILDKGKLDEWMGEKKDVRHHLKL